MMPILVFECTYWIPVVAVNSYHKLSGLTYHRFVSSRDLYLTVWSISVLLNGSCGPKIKRSQHCVLHRVPKENVTDLFSASRDCPHFLALTPFHLPRQQSHHSSLCCHISSLNLTHLTPSFIYKDLCDNSGPPR